MKKTYLFPIELYATNVNIDNNSLIKSLYKIKDTSLGVKVSNKGGWQSEDLLCNKDFQFFKETILKIASETFNTNINLFEIWGNVSSKYHYNAIHHHGKEPNMWSGVYYLQTFKNSGPITIYSPWDTDLHHHFYFTPGTLIFFPSSLPHSVDANMENQDRISIAFNFKIA